MYRKAAWALELWMQGAVTVGGVQIPDRLEVGLRC
jgi:hypothetical protein